MKELFLIFTILFSWNVWSQTIPNDNLKIGTAQNIDKGFEFNFGGTNPKLRVLSADKALNYDQDTLNFGSGAASGTKTLGFNGYSKSLSFGTDAFVLDDSLTIGDGTAADQTLTFDIGAGASNPKLKWDNSANAISFANDGSTFIGIGEQLPRANWAINGDMRINQRGALVLNAAATSATEGSYYIDMFFVNTAGITSTKQWLSTNQPNANDNSYSLRITSTNATTTGNIGFSQKVPAKTGSILVNKEITFSAWVKSNSSIARLRVSVSGGTSYFGSPHTGDGTWQKLYVTGTPDTSTFQIQLIIYDEPTTTVNNGDYIEITQLKLEIGGDYTDFVPKTFNENLWDCLPFFQKSYDYATAVGTASSWDGIRGVFCQSAPTNGMYFDEVFFEREMNGSPTVTFYAFDGTAGSVSYFDNGATIGSASSSLIYKKMFFINNSSGSTYSQSRISYHWTAVSNP